MLERHPDWEGPYTLKEISSLIENEEPLVWDGVFHAFPWRICNTLADLRTLHVILAEKVPGNLKDMTYTVLPRNQWREVSK